MSAGQEIERPGEVSLELATPEDMANELRRRGRVFILTVADDQSFGHAGPGTFQSDLYIGLGGRCACVLSGLFNNLHGFMRANFPGGTNC